MRLCHLVLIFLIISCSMGIVLELQTKYKEEQKQELRIMEEAVAGAVKAASKKQIEYMTDSLLYSATDELKIQTIEDQFFRTLGAGLGLSDRPDYIMQLQRLVPVLCVISDSGYSIGYYGLSENNEFKREWTEERSFAVQYRNKIYCAGLDDLVIMYVNAHDVTKVSVKNDAELRISIRAEAVENAMQFYLDQYRKLNRTTERLSIDLPKMDDGEFVNAVSAPGILAVYYRSMYEGSALAYKLHGTRISKTDCFIVTEEKDGRIYHRSDCTAVSKETDIRRVVFYTRKECAEYGAYAGECCEPLAVHAPN